MSQTRTVGRYKLRAYTTVQLPRAYAVLVIHRDTGKQWLFELPSMDSLRVCEAAIDALTLGEIEQWTAKDEPLQFPEEPRA